MLPERFPDLLDQRLRQSPVKLLSPRTLPLASMLILPRCPMSTFESSMGLPATSTFDCSQHPLLNVPKQKKAANACVRFSRLTKLCDFAITYVLLFSSWSCTLADLVGGRSCCSSRYYHPTGRGQGIRPLLLTITPGSSNRQDMRLWTVESGFESLPRNFPIGKAPSSRGQGRCPLTAETRVRISVGPPKESMSFEHPLARCASRMSREFPCLFSADRFSGAFSGPK
jgi:hypothetical protein